MNPKRLILAIVAVFIAVSGTDYLIHEIWLKPDYTATASLWRTDADFKQHMCWLFLGQFLWAATFVVLYAKGFAKEACMVCAVMFGLFMGLFFGARDFISYAVQPLPGSLPVKWFVAGITQSVLMGLLVFFAYKPKPDEIKPKE